MLRQDTVKEGPVGPPRLSTAYVLEALDKQSMTLSEDGDDRVQREKRAGRQVLQMAQTPPGFCRRRPDRPAVRCEDRQLPCENATA